jgi:hypothetical protein
VGTFNPRLIPGRREYHMPSQISVRVDAPEGLPEPHVTLGYRPATADEFERIVEACGGPVEFKVGYGGDFVYVLRDDGTYIHVQAPKDAELAKPAAHPFIAAFGERIKAATDGEPA